MSPVIRECEKRNCDYFILHTGQHYSYNMDRVFFEQLELPDAKYNLDVGSGKHGEQTGKMLIGIEKILLREKPDVVLVEGDTNTVLAGAIAATKLHIKVGHVEAGLRSYYREMPEEINRILTIFVTGNTIVDAVYQNLQIAHRKAETFKNLDLKEEKYFLVTAHRQENVDNRRRFDGILKGLQLINKEYDLPVIYPIHPRARKRMMEFGLNSDGIKLIEPLDYLSFLQLEANAKLVLTDSGGVQEETCILKIPCVTLRDNTERPETIEVGSNILAGTNPTKIMEAVTKMMDIKRKWKNPFGDGKAGKRIVEIIGE
ncbi:UDP-N-acetylglucosamine 2-epimerase (non-hydrolyzing) [Thermoplasmatales archaeon ex4484_30]|nr:MAG: UDP-N-acetylglucosamine 2-epimerase (non-hydrolyzing) [Thermoplasmatales archaeon ex4484_30]